MISVIMSVYNNEDKLEEAIKSILNQTYKDIEFLIVDDKSSDSSLEILNKFKKIDSRIKIYSNSTNIGLTKSLNKLIKLTKGKLIARQDADDFSSIERFDKQIKFMNKYNLDACTTRARTIGSNKLRPRFTIYFPNKLIIKFKNPFIHGTLLIKKEIINSVGNYDENFYYAQDYKLFFDLLSKGYKIKTMKTSHYFLNIKNNISTNFKEEQAFFANKIKNL